MSTARTIKHLNVGLSEINLELGIRNNHVFVESHRELLAAF